MDNDDYTAKMGDLIELMRLIGNDTQQCEVKECKRKISSTITDTLSAFSNGNGGYIILGMSEKAGFTAVEGFNARAMQEALSQACEKMTPVVRPIIVTCPFEGANLVFAVVDEMLPHDKPCYITTLGPYNGSFIRTGDGDRKMSTYEVDRLVEEQRQPAYDAEPIAGASLNDLNPTLVYGLLAREREMHPHIFEGRSDEDMLCDLRVLTEQSTEEETRELRHATVQPGSNPNNATGKTKPGNLTSKPDSANPAAAFPANAIVHTDTDTPPGTGTLAIADSPANTGTLAGTGTHPLRPTLAGLLACGRYPQKFLPRINVAIAVFPGTSLDEVFADGAQLVTAETITGPIPVMVDDAVDSLMSWTAGTADPTAAPDPGGHDAHQPDYPRGVLREAITNALMHRDYSPDAIGTPVQVNVFTDRIEISNPGGLFGSATKGTMSHKVSPSTRNQYMFNLLQSTPYPDGGSVIENGGTGYQQIEAGLKAEGGEPAIIDNTIQRFTITIPRRRAPNENGERNLAQRIMKLLESRPYASVRDIMTDLGLSPIAVATGLRVLKNKGLIESEPLPQRPQTVYRLVGSNS